MEKARIIVPADGWFEWSNEPRPGDPVAKPFKQPYFVKRTDGEPMYLAALTSVMRDEDAAAPSAGFVIVTAAADEGLVDVHDRCPLVFAPDAARRWLDADASLEEVGALIGSDGVPASHFVCYRISTDVNRTTNDEPRLIEPLETLLQAPSGK